MNIQYTSHKPSMNKMIKFENGVVTQETKIGTISINIAGRKSVYYTLKELDLYDDLHRGVVFPCSIKNGEVVKHGYTFSSHADIALIIDTSSILIDGSRYIIWDDDRSRIII